MDAENALTAPWKSLRDFHKHPRLLFGDDFKNGHKTPCLRG